jgi:hypothetical protein
MLQFELTTVVLYVSSDLYTQGGGAKHVEPGQLQDY